MIAGKYEEKRCITPEGWKPLAFKMNGDLLKEVIGLKHPWSTFSSIMAKWRWRWAQIVMMEGLGYGWRYKDFFTDVEVGELDGMVAVLGLRSCESWK